MDPITESQDALPQAGGRYARQPDGSLVRTDMPEADHMVDAPAQPESKE